MGQEISSYQSADDYISKKYPALSGDDFGPVFDQIIGLFKEAGRNNVTYAAHMFIDKTSENVRKFIFQAKQAILSEYPEWVKVAADIMPAVMERTKLEALKEFIDCFGRGKDRQRRQDLIGAETAFLRAIELAPEDPAPYVNLGKIYCDRGEFEKALRYLQKAIDLNPASDWTLRRVGAIHRELGKQELHQGCHKKTTEELASAFGELILAEEYYRKALMVAPKNNFALSELADTLLIEGAFAKDPLAKEKYEEAWKLLFKSLKIDRSSKFTRAAFFTLAEAFYRQKEWKKVTDILEALTNAGVDHFKNLAIFCEAYFYQGNYNKAIEYLEKAAGIAIENPKSGIEIYEWLARVYSKLDDRQKEQSCREKILELQKQLKTDI
ncbi:MAG: tetratricopeptide repeat protein [bacterium]